MARRTELPAPVTVGDVAPVFRRLFTGPIALAVSGGADSMALLHLVSAWLASGGRVPAEGGLPPVIVLTVDHALRAESAEEAAFVRDRSTRLGLPHATLRWDGPKPATGIAEAARQARYDLLRDHILAEARDAGLPPSRIIVTAHQRDDVAETFLMRLARGSGLEGLAALGERGRWPAEGWSIDQRPSVTICRPLLSIPKDRLIVTLARDGHGWREDPSNQDARYERARVRAVLERLEAVGIGARAIDAAVGSLIAVAVTARETGEARVDLAMLRAASEEPACRLLSHVVRAVRGSIWPPRLGRVEQCLGQLRGDAPPATLSLGGCILARDPGTLELLVIREVRGEGLPRIALAAGGSGVWDDRFRVTVAADVPAPLTVRGLARSEWRSMAEETRACFGHDVPERLALTMPAVFAGDRLIALGPPGRMGLVSVECCLPLRLGAR